MSIQSVDLVALGPALALALGALLALVVDLILARGPQLPALAALGSTVVAAALLPASKGRQTLCVADGCSYTVGSLTIALQAITLAALAVVLLLSVVVVKDLSLPSGEHFFLLLSSAAGAVVVAASTDLVSLIIALELVSLPSFALIGLHRSQGRAGEAALKAFLYSVVSVAVSLYGIALLYGSTGWVSFADLSRVAASTDPTPVEVAGLVMLLAVVLFKISAIPFHAWAPDAYEAAPISVAAFLSVVSKTAGFAALALVLATFLGWSEVWAPVIAVMAAVTMVGANAIALRQRGAVRLLAWSSIAQAGYVMVPFGAVVAGIGGAEGLLVPVVAYLATYAAMNLGAFAVVAVVARDRPNPQLSDFAGLARRSPWLGGSLAFFLACLAGLPPGIIGLLVKVQVLAVPVATGAWWLAGAMAVGTVIGLAYYLTWAAVLFRSTSSDRLPSAKGLTAWPVKLAVAVTLATTVVLSVAPSLALGLLDRV